MRVQAHSKGNETAHRAAALGAEHEAGRHRNKERSKHTEKKEQSHVNGQICKWIV